MPVDSTLSTQGTEHGSSAEEQHLFFLLCFLGMMLCFFFGGAAMEKYKPRIGHQTGLTIVIGIAVSFLLWETLGESHVKQFEFSHEVFFNFFLPPIIFNSGYTMRKRKFFENLGNIMISGVGVTFASFAIYSFFTWIFLFKMDLQMTNYYARTHKEDGEYYALNPAPIKIDIMQMLLITSLLCSTDVIAAVSIVDYGQQPKLYSCIFGEGIVNDVVSIILFYTVLNLQTVEFSWYTPFVIVYQFLMLGIVSLTIGLIFGLMTSYIFKRASFLRVSAITETFLLLAFGMISYFIADLTVVAGIKMSGIISLLTCGIVMSHYTYYNLSEQGKVASTITFTFLGHSAEAGVYSYIAIALYSNIPGWWSFEFIVYETILIIFGRVAAIFATFYAFNTCFKSRTLNPKELLFISWGGVIRGAIAFALVLKIPTAGTHTCTIKQEDCFTQQNYELMVSSTLVIVYITTLIFGTFMAVVQKIWVPSKAGANSVDQEHAHEHEGVSHHSIIIHPNEEVSMNASIMQSLIPEGTKKPWTWATSNFVARFKSYDQNTLKPMFIRKQKSAFKDDDDFQPPSHTAGSDAAH